MNFQYTPELLKYKKEKNKRHIAVEVAKAVDDLADYYCVACIDEAVELRQHDITKPILILGYTDSSYFEDLISFDVTTAIYSLEDAKLLSAKAEEMGKPAKVHIKVDSGMSRIGFQCTDEELEKAIAITKLPGIVVDGIFTHYAKAIGGTREKTAGVTRENKGG